MKLKLLILKIIVVFSSHIFSKSYLYILPLASEASLDISSKGFSSKHTNNNISVLVEYHIVSSLSGLRSFVFCILVYFILVWYMISLGSKSI